MAKTTTTNGIATINLTDAELISALETLLAEVRARQAKAEEPKKASAKKTATSKATAKAVESKVEKPVAKATKASAKSTKATKVAETPSKASAKAYWVRNAEHNGIEVVFAEKPSTEIREHLKKSGFRWHNTRKVWFAKETEARVEVAKKACGF